MLRNTQNPSTAHSGAHCASQSGCLFSAKTLLNCDGMDHYNCLRLLSERQAKTKPLSSRPLSLLARPYLTNGPHTDRQSSHTSMAGGWTNTHITHHASHTLIALDLILFHLQWKTVRQKKGEAKKQRGGKVSGWRGGPFFHRWNEKLALQRSVRASAGSTVGQTTGGCFFFPPPCSLSNYMAQEKA